MRIIEGIDIANIGGKEAVGSLVKFIDGRPFKAGYRRFKIKTVEGSDDYAMIAEVVRRRYKYAMAGEELWPDLILIDGGLGQLHAAENALKELFTAENAETAEKTLNNLRVAGIAKREEELYFQGSTKPLKLPRHSPALKLLAIRPRRGAPVRPALFSHFAKKKAVGIIHSFTRTLQLSEKLLRGDLSGRLAYSASACDVDDNDRLIAHNPSS